MLPSKQKPEDEKMDEPITLESFASQIFQNQEIMIKRQTEIAKNMEILNRRLMLIERDVRVLHSKSHETKIYVKRGLAECKEYLKACQKGYHNISEFSEAMLEETEELQNSLATAQVNSWG
jgi:hypothetical protein